MPDVIIIICIACIVGFSIFVMVRNKLKGKNSCGCDCANCPGCKSKNTENQNANKL